MRWFRVYGDMPDDPKVGTLNDAEFRTWIELLCLASREETNGVTSCNLENANWLLRRNVTVTLHTLSQRGLIAQNRGGFIVITKWEERQKSSDSSNNRVKKYREKTKYLEKRNVTCNDSVTLQSENVTVQIREEKRREEKKVSNKGSRFTLTEMPEEWKQFSIQERKDLVPEKVFSEFSDYWIAVPGSKGSKLDWFATWRNWIRNQKGKLNIEKPKEIRQGMKTI